MSEGVPPPMKLPHTKIWLSERSIDQSHRAFDHPMVTPWIGSHCMTQAQSAHVRRCEMLQACGAACHRQTDTRGVYRFGSFACPCSHTLDSFPWFTTLTNGWMTRYGSMPCFRHSIAHDRICSGCGMVWSFQIASSVSPLSTVALLQQVNSKVTAIGLIGCVFAALKLSVAPPSPGAFLSVSFLPPEKYVGTVGTVGIKSEDHHECSLSLFRHCAFSVPTNPVLFRLFASFSGIRSLSFGLISAFQSIIFRFPNGWKNVKHPLHAAARKPFFCC